MNLDLDQHFLESKHVLLLEKKVSNISKNDIIFEIGAGDGRLSHFILEDSPKKLISIEMDFNFEPNLNKLKEKHNNFEFIIGNGLELIKKYKFNKLISNIPYSITEPLYNKILKLKIPVIILLHGNTFYNIIQDENNKWHYLINSFYKIEKILDVAGNAFNPPAKTMSVLIKLELKKEKELEKIDKFIQILFSKNKRNFKNTLIFSLVDIGLTKKNAKKIILDLKLNKNLENSKLENISNNDFIKIIKSLKALI